MSKHVTDALAIVLVLCGAAFFAVVVACVPIGMGRTAGAVVSTGLHDSEESFDINPRVSEVRRNTDEISKLLRQRDDLEHERLLKQKELNELAFERDRLEHESRIRSWRNEPVELDERTTVSISSSSCSASSSSCSASSSAAASSR